MNARFRPVRVALVALLPFLIAGCSGNRETTPEPSPAPTTVQPEKAGAHPSEPPPSAAYDFVAVDFVDASRGWIAAADDENNAGAIFRTTDAGGTWTKTAEFGQDVLRDVDFVDPTNGWAVGETAIYRTTDGGVTWAVDAEHVVWNIQHETEPVKVGGTDASTPLMAAEFLTSIFFVDAKTGWAGVDAPATPTDPSRRRGIVLGTTDGGATWKDLTGRSLPYPVTDIWFVTAREGWAAAGNVETNDVDVLLHTTDGGRTWTRQETGAPQMVRAVHFADGKRGWAVGLTIDLDSGEYGIARIVATSDGGKTWTQQFPSQRSFFDVFFADPLHGWAVGDRSAVYATADGGKSWTQQSRFASESAWQVPAAGKTMSASGRRRVYSTLYALDATNAWVGGEGLILERK